MAGWIEEFGDADRQVTLVGLIIDISRLWKLTDDYLVSSGTTARLKIPGIQTEKGFFMNERMFGVQHGIRGGLGR